MSALIYSTSLQRLRFSTPVTADYFRFVHACSISCHFEWKHRGHREPWSLYKIDSIIYGYFMSPLGWKQTSLSIHRIRVYIYIYIQRFRRNRCCSHCSNANIVVARDGIKDVNNEPGWTKFSYSRGRWARRDGPHLREDAIVNYVPIVTRLHLVPDHQRETPPVVVVVVVALGPNRVGPVAGVKVTFVKHPSNRRYICI